MQLLYLSIADVHDCPHVVVAPSLQAQRPQVVAKPMLDELSAHPAVGSATGGSFDAVRPRINRREMGE